MVKFKAKTYKAGSSRAIIIPSDFIKHGLIDPEKTYQIEIKEAKNGER